MPAVLLAPRPVFVALRDEARDDLDARAEPILALVLLAGIASVLAHPGPPASSSTTAIYDGLARRALWAVFAAVFTAFVGYFVVGGALYLGARGLGSLGTSGARGRSSRSRSSRSCSRCSCSGRSGWPSSATTSFARGGADDGGAGARCSRAAEIGFALWAAALVLARRAHGARLELVALPRVARPSSPSS